MIGHFLAAPQVGLVGILFDQQSGLLIANPIYLLAVPGLVLLWRRDKRLALASGLVFLSIYLPNNMYNIWYGGFASPARLHVARGSSTHDHAGRCTCLRLSPNAMGLCGACRASLPPRLP